MNVTINGNNKTVGENLSVRGLLQSLDFKPEGTVVERNGDIVDRDAYEGTLLADGDTIELVRFVGGG